MKKKEKKEKPRTKKSQAEAPLELEKLKETLIQAFQDRHTLFIATAVVAYLFLAAPRERPKWLKGCPPVHGRKAGAWRGKGSFGHGFGPSLVRHK